MENIIIEKKQTFYLRMLLLSFILTTTSLITWIIRMKRNRTVFSFSLILTIFFCIVFFIILNKTLQKRPLITITFDGIIDCSSDKSVGFIPFGDIDKFLIMDNPNRKSIGIIPKDEEAFIKKLSPIKQDLARVNVAKQLPPFELFLNDAKDMSLEDIYTLLKKRHNDYCSLYD